MVLGYLDIPEVNWGKESVINIKIAEEKDFDDVKNHPGNDNGNLSNVLSAWCCTLLCGAPFR